MNIFEYGPLTWPDLWQHEVRNHYSEKLAIIKDFRCRRVKKEFYPALIRSPQLEISDDIVTGKVYLNVNTYDFDSIKSYHGKEFEIINHVCFTEENESPIDCKIFLWKPEYKTLLSSDEWTREWFEEKALNSFRREINQSLF